MTELRQDEILRLAHEGDRIAAEEMLQRNSGLIWSVARRYFGRGVDPEDLFQLGCVGFLKAVNGFDLEYGTQFSTYAVPKIAGEIRRFLRDDGTIKVSRSLKERAVQIRQAKASMEQRLGREPLLSELSQELGFTTEEIAECETATTPADSLQRVTGEDGFTLEHILGDFGAEERLVESVALKEAISGLPEQERAVILLRFYRGLTQDVTGRIMKVSQVQVSRLERRGLRRLREMLE
ncbi:MAG: sigma-70 family RNA polymerase sigma factor [Oscillospiraceae bacterium]|nr:sigma-70 family RNA polymerase sigma factor [Oscillospiraceae bacterium]